MSAAPSPAPPPTLPSLVRAELRPMLRLAVPVVTAELAWSAMGLVDSLIMGRFSATAMGAVGLANAITFAVMVMGMGLLLGLDYAVSTAWGAGDTRRAGRALGQGLLLAAGISPPLMLLLAQAPAALVWWGVEAEVISHCAACLQGLTWSLPALLIYTALRRFLQAVNVVGPIMALTVLANLLNAGACYVLVMGKLGLPAMGAAGAGWATCGSRIFLMVGLLGVTLRHPRLREVLHPGDLRPDPETLRALVRLGLPAAGHLLLEVGMFSFATALAARMGGLDLAAHQIALQIASFTFMVPLGLSSAGAVRVGNAVGRGDTQGARVAGWTAFALGLSFMAVSALVLALARYPIVRTFTPDPEVLPLGASLLVVAAFFQVFDAGQVIGSGVLRGVGDTRTPMIANFVGHWLLGLPVGWYLAFHAGWGVQGLWGGLCVGLGVVAVSLLATWARRWRGVGLA